jgi:hypothetical protein
MSWRVVRPDARIAQPRASSVHHTSAAAMAGTSSHHTSASNFT